jgi:hypothetical protein
VSTQTDIQCIFQLLHEPVDKNKHNKNTEVTVLCNVLLYVLIPGINLHIFVVTVRHNVRNTDCVMPCVMLFRDKDEINYFNYFVSILFTLKCHIIPYTLTPLFSDDDECTRLT